MTRPWVNFLGLARNVQEKRSVEEKLALQTHRVEFRIQEYHVEPSQIRSWCKEWGWGPSQQLILLRLLLQQLPEVSGRQSSVIQRRDLIQSILSLTSEGRRVHPENAFYWLAESLVLFYSGQDAASLVALKRAEHCSGTDAGLKELNHSEEILWQADRMSWVLFPPVPQVWGLHLERPFNVWSHGLALQERALLQRYNIERAVELGFLHLELAMRISEMGWAPSDQAMARSIANRALEPFWNRKEINPTAAQLEKNFINFMEDQGDQLGAAKVRAWFSTLASQETAAVHRTFRWRYIQMLASWDAANVLAALFLQTASLLLVLGMGTVILGRSPNAFSEKTNEVFFSNPVRMGLAVLAFSVGPIIGTIARFFTGGIFQLIGLVGGWILWWRVMAFKGTKLSWTTFRTMLVYLLIVLSVAILFTTGAMALVLQYRQKYLNTMMEYGLLADSQQ